MKKKLLYLTITFSSALIVSGVSYKAGENKILKNELEKKNQVVEGSKDIVLPTKEIDNTNGVENVNAINVKNVLENLNKKFETLDMNSIYENYENIDINSIENIKSFINELPIIDENLLKDIKVGTNGGKKEIKIGFDFINDISYEDVINELEKNTFLIQTLIPSAEIVTFNTNKASYVGGYDYYLEFLAENHLI